MITNPYYFTIIILFLASAAASQAIPEQRLKTARPAVSSYQPITSRQRLTWLAQSTIGPESLAAGLFSASLGTAMNRPTEYGPHWRGFGKRYAMRFTGISIGNAVEAGFGSLWGENLLYFRGAGQPFKGRLKKNIAVMTFAAPRADGSGARLCPLSRQCAEQFPLEHLAGGQ